MRGLDVIRDDSRYPRWERIFDQYRALGVAAEPAIQPAERIVVDPDSALAEIVELTSPCGTKLHVVATIEAAIELANGLHGRAALLVAPRHLLTNAAVAAICRLVRTALGIVTARDPGAIAHMLLKQQLARGLAPGLSISIDFVGDSLTLRDRNALEQAAGPVSALPAEALAGLLTKPRSGLLLAHCHGDGAHGNFGNVVLCGLSDDIERFDDGRVGTCRRLADDSLICKRNSAGQRLPLRCGDIASTSIGLLTCNGSAVAGEGYPSDCSFALSFAEGFPASILTTDRRIPFRPEDIAHVETVVAQAGSFGEATLALNDWWETGHGARPYVLFGDPNVAPGAEAIKSGAPRTKVRSEAPSPPASPAPVARSSESHGLLNCVASLAARLSLQEAVLATCSGLAAQSDEAERAIEAHGRILRLLRRHLGLGLEMGAGDRPPGDRRIQAWRGVLSALIGSADQSVLRLIHRHVPQRELPLLFSSGLSGTRQGSDRACDFCGTELDVERNSSPLVAPAYFETAACPHCGPVSAWDQGGRLVMLTSPRSGRPGERMTIGLGLSCAASVPLASSPRPLASLRFRDVGKSQDLDLDGAAIGALPRSLTLTLPMDTTLENNTLRVVAAHALSLGFQRAALLVLPR